MLTKYAYLRCSDSVQQKPDHSPAIWDMSRFNRRFSACRSTGRPDFALCSKILKMGCASFVSLFMLTRVTKFSTVSVGSIIWSQFLVIGQKHCVFSFLSWFFRANFVTFSSQNCHFFITKLLFFHHAIFGICSKILQELFCAPRNALVRFFRIRGPHFFCPGRPNLTRLFTLACTHFFDHVKIFADQKADTGNAHALEWRAPEH